MITKEPITRDSILKLMEKKDQIEGQLRDLKLILDGNNIGMKEPLVDREGYPRQDIDVYQVRQARHKIICLQNDHKSVMSEIEKGLHFLHSQSNSNAGTSTHTVPQEKEGRPFARVSHVEPNSPANLAGLQVDDLILSFGSLNFDNYKSLQDIASVVQHSVGHNVPVLVKRGTNMRKITLVPKEWNKKGLLGCTILDFE